MDTRQAYNSWAIQYDTNLNRTRDLEGHALRASLADIPFASCLEIGCGTGKNTVWLGERARQVTAVDISGQMLALAKEKISSGGVDFVEFDINRPWTFRKQSYDLVSFSLVLEHIEDLNPIFHQAWEALNPGGHIYIGELHPFKQYSGTRARFDTEEGRQVVPCFNHHITDFTRLPLQYGLTLAGINEYFDDDDRNAIPRILTVLLKKE